MFTAATLSCGMRLHGTVELQWDVFDGALNVVKVSEYVQSSRRIIAASTGNERKLV